MKINKNLEALYIILYNNLKVVNSSDITEWLKLSFEKLNPQYYNHSK